MTCVHFLQVICRSYFRQFVCDRAYAEIVSQSLLGSTYAKAFGCVGIQHLKTDSTITFSFDFMLSSRRRCPHVISFVAFVYSSHFRISGVAVELHHGVSDDCQSWRQKLPQAVPLNLDIWSHTFAFAVHEFLPHVSHAFYFSCYLLGSHSSCLNDLFQLISEHTHSFQILQATLDPSTFTLDTRHSTIDNILGSHQTYYIQHFPLSTLHFTLYTARPTCYTLRRITFALHTFASMSHFSLHTLSVFSVLS